MAAFVQIDLSAVALRATGASPAFSTLVGTPITISMTGRIVDMIASAARPVN
jgi:hypothetical protein